MTKKLCFATNNKHKIREIQSLLGLDFHLLSLEDIGCFQELEETQNTIAGNSAQKAQFIYANFGQDCFADDTGLEVEALNGEPGVFSARYAGNHRNSEDNMDMLLQKLKGESNRAARFRTVITLIINGKQHQFEGIVEGVIALERKGNKGFGYDPLFIPDGYKLSFAQMDLEEKNNISHRARAIQALVSFLEKNS